MNSPILFIPSILANIFFSILENSGSNISNATLAMASDIIFALSLFIQSLVVISLAPYSTANFLLDALFRHPGEERLGVAQQSLDLEGAPFMGSSKSPSV